MIKKGRPRGTIRSHLYQVDRLKKLFIKHTKKYGIVRSEQHYQGMLDGIDLVMELKESIKTFERDLAS